MDNVLAFLSIVLTHSKAPPHGPFDVIADKFHVGGLLAPGSQEASIYYPEGSVPPNGFPVVSFAHGAPAGGDKLLKFSYGEMLRGLASWGYVVVAPDSCVPPVGWSCEDTLWKDQLRTVTVAKADPSVHTGFSAANFTRVGVIGHSYGADATVYSAGADGVAAAVVMHPARIPEAADINVPTMVITGSKDVICPPQDAQFVYDLIQARPKYLLELKGGTHMEPTVLPVWIHGKDGQNRMSPSLTMFLACHLWAWNAEEGCAFVQGVSGEEVCNQSNITMSKCDVELEAWV